MLAVDYLHSTPCPRAEQRYFVSVFGSDIDAALTARMHESGFDIGRHPRGHLLTIATRTVVTSHESRLTWAASKRLPRHYTIGIGTMRAAVRQQFDVHTAEGWQWLARHRSTDALDREGHWRLYDPTQPS
jgi:hypothetical protein